MYEVPCEKEETFALFLTFCYFIQGYSEGAKDVLAAQGQMWDEKEEINLRVLHFLENTSNCIILRAGLE